MKHIYTYPIGILESRSTPTSGLIIQKIRAIRTTGCVSHRLCPLTAVFSAFGASP
jgi:hypothetical protein